MEERSVRLSAYEKTLQRIASVGSSFERILYGIGVRDFPETIYFLQLEHGCVGDPAITTSDAGMEGKSRSNISTCAKR